MVIVFYRSRTRDCLSTFWCVIRVVCVYVFLRLILPPHTTLLLLFSMLFLCVFVLPFVCCCCCFFFFYSSNIHFLLRTSYLCIGRKIVSKRACAHTYTRLIHQDNLLLLLLLPFFFFIWYEKHWLKIKAETRRNMHTACVCVYDVATPCHGSSHILHGYWQTCFCFYCILSCKKKWNEQQM